MKSIKQRRDTILILPKDEVCATIGCESKRASSDSNPSMLFQQCRQCLDKHKMECKVSNLQKKKQQKEMKAAFLSLQKQKILADQEIKSLTKEVDRLTQKLAKFRSGN